MRKGRNDRPLEQCAYNNEIEGQQKRRNENQERRERNYKKVRDGKDREEIMKWRNRQRVRKT